MAISTCAAIVGGLGLLAGGAASKKGGTGIGRTIQNIFCLLLNTKKSEYELTENRKITCYLSHL